MKRTNAVLVSIVAVALAVALTAASATAKTDYSSVTAKDSATTGQTPTAGSAAVTPAGQPVTAAQADTGFDWGDALIGAGVALCIALISATALHGFRRRGHFPVGTRA